MTDGSALDAMIEADARSTLRMFDGLNERDLCAVQGLCGQPGVRCPKHQQHLTCRVELDGWGAPKPGSEKRISTAEEGEDVLRALRWLWSHGCGKERPGIEAQAARVKARISEIQDQRLARVIRFRLAGGTA